METGDSKKYWFVRKLYGWGRTPASKEGRIIVSFYVLLVVSRVLFYNYLAQKDQSMLAGTDLEYNAGGNLLVLLVPIIIMSVILITICYKKGESPKRQWGQRK